MLATDFLRSSLLLLSSFFSATSPRTQHQLPVVYGILIYDRLTTLDMAGPLAYLNNLPDVQIFFIHDSMNPTPSGNATFPLHELYAGEFYQPVYTMETAPPLDVLLVPGGYYATGLAVADERWALYIKKVYPNLQYLFSVCTGSAIVAKSGVLDGKKATSNKAMFKVVEALGPNVDWVAEARWVVDGNIWTSSGVEAGTDMANAFVRHVYGKHVAKSISDLIEYTPITNSSHDPFAPLYNLTTVMIAEKPENSFTQWGILAPPGFIALDAISVAIYAEFMTVIPGYLGNISVIAPTLDHVKMSSVVPGGGQSIVPTHELSNPPSKLDILIVPGLPTAGPFPHQHQFAKYIRCVYPSLKHIISVGTGSVLLASSGILEGRRATTTKSLFHAATKPYREGHDITWTTGRWVRDGNVWTTSGTASGLDAANALSIEMFGTRATHRATMSMEYIPSTNASHDPFAHLIK